MDLAIDISNWQGPVGTARVTCWGQNGVRYVIPQAVNPPAGFPVGQTREQMQACADAGMPTPVYVFYWPTQDPAVAQEAMRLTEGFDVHSRWLDCEANTPAGMSHEAVIAELHTLCDLLHIDGIYTRKDWWETYTGNTTEFSNLMLWDAFWTDGRQDFSYWDNPAHRYGGWETVALKQYGTGSLCGSVGLDMNIVNPEVLDTMTYVGDDYWAKFGPDGNDSLANDRDWPGVAANLEGIISQVQQQTGGDAACEEKLAQIQNILGGTGQ